MLNEELAAAAVHAALKDRGLAIDDGGHAGRRDDPGRPAGTRLRLDGPRPARRRGPDGGALLRRRLRVEHGRLRRRGAGDPAGDHDAAVVVGSELVSRSLRQRREGSAQRSTPSSCAGRCPTARARSCCEPLPARTGLSLRLDWTHLVSYAHERPVCMSAGGSTPRPGRPGSTRIDRADGQRCVQLRQDVAMLPDLFRTGAA